MYVWLICVGNVCMYIYINISIYIHIYSIYMYLQYMCTFWVTVSHNCNWAWWLNLWSRTQFSVQSAFGVILIVFFSFKLFLWTYLVNVLLKRIHIFMFVVYGLYFGLFTSMVPCYLLSVLFVFLWHTLDLTTLLLLYFFFRTISIFHGCAQF